MIPRRRNRPPWTVTANPKNDPSATFIPQITVDELIAMDLPDVVIELVTTGTGIRARHVLGVGLDLGLPTGVLAGLVATEAEQNGHMGAALLAEHGVSYLPHGTVGHQPAVHLTAANAAVANGYPPCGLYELPAAVGKIPPHRGDAGALLLADAFGADRMIYVKDVDGVLTADPRKVPDATPVPSATAAELLGNPFETLPVDRVVLELMSRAKHVRRIQVVNGLTPGALTAAPAGEDVGTVVHAD